MSVLVRVAAGVLIDAAGRCLVAQRPAGKIAAGRWEFPGGKIEADETPEQALHRELEEELGIRVRAAEPLIQIRHAYSDRSVHMWVYRVPAWEGRLVAHDGQALDWSTLADLDQIDLLGADGPIVQALRLPRQMPITPAHRSVAELQRLADAWQAQGFRLARLRQPALGDAEYLRRAEDLIRRTNIGWILDRGATQAAALGAAGLHLTERAMRSATQRPVADDLLCGASVHDPLSWRQARQLGCDYALLGPVLPTPTHPGTDVLGWAGFAQCVAQGSLPTYALGGLGPADQPQAAQNWAQGIAGISAYDLLQTGGA